MGISQHKGKEHTQAPWYAASTSMLDNIFQGSAKPIYSMDTNVHPAFAVDRKLYRNRKLVNTVFHNRAGVMLIGDRTQETLSDPLHRDPRYILQNFRQNSGGLGIDRSAIRAAAPGQVTWKNTYWRVQKPPYRAPIGPYTHGQLQQQSILYRITHWQRQGTS